MNIHLQNKMDGWKRATAHLSSVSKLNNSFKFWTASPFCFIKHSCDLNSFLYLKAFPQLSHSKYFISYAT